MEVKEEQLDFSDWEHSPVKKQTRKEKSLWQVGQATLLKLLVKVLEPFYLQMEPQGGRPPWQLEPWCGLTGCRTGAP